METNTGVVKAVQFNGVIIIYPTDPCCHGNKNVGILTQN